MSIADATGRKVVVLVDEYDKPLLQTIGNPDRYIYVMEFKYNGTAQEAIDQIESKGYALPFINDSREVIKVGVNFDGATRHIAGWIIR